LINQAVILCGGYGKRLLPLTKKIPKGMVEVDGKPFLEHLIDQCKSNGIKKVLLLCGYKYDVIKNFFTNKKINVEVQSL
jgi:NDP-sugar pyrophosphorylase family protein